MRPEVAVQISQWLQRVQYSPAEFGNYQIAMQELQQVAQAGSTQETNDGDSSKHKDQTGG